MNYLVDTNVISELRKRTPDSNVEAWYEGVAGRQLFLSVLTLSEIRMGVERARRKDPAKAVALENWLTRLQTSYSDRIVPVDADVTDTWARLSVPDPLPVIDGLLAATAAVRNWTLVTRNTDDVERPGVRVLNPFNAARPGSLPLWRVWPGGPRAGRRPWHHAGQGPAHTSSGVRVRRQASGPSIWNVKMCCPMRSAHPGGSGTASMPSLVHSASPGAPM